MAKKWICLILAAVLACSLCACSNSKDDNPQMSHTPSDYETVAETFLEAYYTRDRATYYSLMFFDARRQWEDSVIASNGSAEAFFAEAQKQADDKGIAASVDSFDSYYAAYHQFIKTDLLNIYGTYTLTTTATDSKKLEGDILNEYRDKQLNAIDNDYIDADALLAVTDAYLVTVQLHIDGEKKTLNENYLVYLLYHDGAWRVLSHSI